ncbi:unnamed protein product, partial [Ectocarpus sp. 13 AM-2016]
WCPGLVWSATGSERRSTSATPRRRRKRWRRTTARPVTPAWLPEAAARLGVTTAGKRQLTTRANFPRWMAEHPPPSNRAPGGRRRLTRGWGCTAARRLTSSRQPRQRRASTTCQRCTLCSSRWW